MAPGRPPPSRRCADTLRRFGVWDDPCLASVWREALPDGTPVRDETCALACVLSHCGDVEVDGGRFARLVLDALGEETTKELLEECGRSNMTQTGWRYWRCMLGMTLDGDDNDPALFLDGWMARLASAGEPSPDPGAWRPGEIPHTEEGEKIVWGHHDGEVVGLPY